MAYFDNFNVFITYFDSRLVSDAIKSARNCHFPPVISHHPKATNPPKVRIVEVIAGWCRRLQCIEITWMKIG